jgi:hypothetical protein
MQGKFVKVTATEVTIDTGASAKPVPPAEILRSLTLSNDRKKATADTQVFLNGAASSLAALQAGDFVMVSGNPVVRIDATR